MVSTILHTLPSIRMNDHDFMESSSPTHSDDEEQKLSCKFTEIPLTALRTKTRLQLSSLLNSKKILHSELGYERDWRGLSALAQLKNCYDESSISSGNPTATVLDLWCKNNPNSATFGHLQEFLGIIDRWDACDDIYENLVEDAKSYEEKQKQKKPTTSLSTTDDDDFEYGSDPNVITIDDTIRLRKSLPLTKYDAFVLFDDADIDYANELLTKLEDKETYNFKLCVKDRLLPGLLFEHVALTKLIEERCKFLVLIITKNFLRIPADKYFIDYTQAFQIQQNKRKIIPILYEADVELPNSLKFYTKLMYREKPDKLSNFWEKLATSLQRNQSVSIPVETNDLRQNCSSTISRVQPSLCTTSKLTVDMKKPMAPSLTTASLKPLPPALTKTSSTPKLLPKFSFTNSLKRTKTLSTKPKTPIPDIVINYDPSPLDDDDNQPKKNKKKDKEKEKDNDIFQSEKTTLYRAQSTSQLSMIFKRNKNASLSNLSTGGKKTKPLKILKKFFSRSSSKLQVSGPQLS